MMAPLIGAISWPSGALRSRERYASIASGAAACRKTQRRIGFGRCRASPLRPDLGVAAHSVVAAFIAKTSQLFKNTDERQPLTPRLALIR